MIEDVDKKILDTINLFLTQEFNTLTKKINARIVEASKKLTTKKSSRHCT